MLYWVRIVTYFWAMPSTSIMIPGSVSSNPPAHVCFFFLRQPHSFFCVGPSHAYVGPCHVFVSTAPHRNLPSGLVCETNTDKPLFTSWAQTLPCSSLLNRLSHSSGRCVPPVKRLRPGGAVPEDRQDLPAAPRAKTRSPSFRSGLEQPAFL